jgi:hypothetical protein
MLTRLRQVLAGGRRRWSLAAIRREFRRYGYSLATITDAELVSALPRGASEIASPGLSAKIISRTLQRLSLI